MGAVRGMRKRGCGPVHVSQAGYLLTRDRQEKKCRVHRGCWEAYCGPLPAGFELHHRDGDGLNNDIQNLVAMPAKQHRRLHSSRLRVHVPVSEAVERYRAGASSRMLAKRYGVHRRTILRRLRAAGVSIPQRSGPRGRRRIDVPLDEVVRRYVAGESTEGLGRAFGVAGSTIGRWLKQLGVALRSHAGCPHERRAGEVNQ